MLPRRQKFKILARYLIVEEMRVFARMFLGVFVSSNVGARSRASR